MLGSRNFHKKSAFSLGSQDFDVEGAALDGDDYDAGLVLPLMGSSGDAHGTAWSAKGPAAFKPALTPLGSVREHLGWARAGWRDANRWLEAGKLVAGSSEIRNGLLKGFLLTSAVVGGIYFLEFTFIPTHIFVHNERSDVTVNSLQNVFLVYPLIAAAYWIASLWTVDVAKAAYSYKHGRSFSVVPNLPAGTSRRFLQESYRIILVLNYLAICYVLQKIPLLGRPLAFVFMSFIDGYYIFETIWVARGWSLERRMRYAECRWSYFVAFGLPSTLISFFHPSGLLNVMLFMLIFPFCAVLALLSSPQPRSQPPSEPWLARIPFFIVTVKLHRALLRTFPAPAHRAPIYAGSAGAGRSGALGAGGGGGGAAYGYGAGMGAGPNRYGGVVGSAGAVAGGVPSAFDGSGSIGRRTAAQMVGGAWGASNGSSPRLDAGVFGSQQRGGSTEIARGGGMGGPNATGSSGIASPHASAALQSPVRGTSAAAASGMGGGGAPPSAPPMGPARFGRAAAGGAPSKAGKKD
ncbi:unnamed protein product [Tilletia laevis]|nr:unnamed protein product [Tilletia laevis]CAD6962420.1 unnamed protein product [Tilletia laevis]